MEKFNKILERSLSKTQKRLNSLSKSYSEDDMEMLVSGCVKIVNEEKGSLTDLMNRKNLTTEECFSFEKRRNEKFENLVKNWVNTAMGFDKINQLALEIKSL